MTTRQEAEAMASRAGVDPADYLNDKVDVKVDDGSKYLPKGGDPSQFNKPGTVSGAVSKQPMQHHCWIADM